MTPIWLKNYWIGRKHKESSKEKMKLAKLGKKRGPMDQDCKDKISIAHKGRIITWGDKVSETLKKKGIKPPSRFGLPITEEHKVRLSQLFSGKGHYNWQGGITPKNLKVRRSRKYRLWRKSVFERDDYTCQSCGTRGGELNADHVKPFALYENLRFELSNGKTLCVTCHRKTDTFAGRSRQNFIKQYV